VLTGVGPQLSVCSDTEHPNAQAVEAVEQALLDWQILRSDEVAAIVDSLVPSSSSE
jgi:hypothetical protein